LDELLLLIVSGLEIAILLFLDGSKMGSNYWWLQMCELSSFGSWPASG